MQNPRIAKKTRYTSSTTGTIPAAIDVTGATITSIGTYATIAGSGDIHRVREGVWIYAANCVREVKHVHNYWDATSKSYKIHHIELHQAFATDVTGVALKVVPVNFRAVSVFNNGTVAGVLQEAVLDPKAVNNAENDYGVAPISFDATGTTFVIDVTE